MYYVYWIQYVHADGGWVWSEKYMNLLPASENHLMRIKVGPFYIPNPQTDIGFAYDESSVTLTFSVDGQA